MIHANMNLKRVLVIAAGPLEANPLVVRLRSGGCRVEFATSTTDAISKAILLRPEVVVLDGCQADKETLQLTLQIRGVLPVDSAPTFVIAIPISYGEGDAAACDAQPSPSTAPSMYKPELADRVENLLSLAPVEVELDADRSERIQCQGLCLDRIRHRAWLEDQLLDLTPTEFKLLWELASHPGYVRTRQDLCAVCKGTLKQVQTRTVDAHIKSIRRKLRERAPLIETVHGVGYRFRD